MYHLSEIIPFCLSHFTDDINFSHRSYISLSTKVRDLDNKIQRKCKKKKTSNIPLTSWDSVDVFYAINPLISPLSKGMKLFCARKNLAWPYQTTSVTQVYDIFNNSAQGTYFIAYSTPVPFSSPLYIWHRGNLSSTQNIVSFTTNEAYITFDNKEPPDNIKDAGKLKWTQAILSPIYVLRPKIFGPNYKDIKFTCNNGVCLPFLTPLPNIYNPSGLQTPKLLRECLVDCNILVNTDNKGNPFDLIPQIRKEYLKTKGQSPIHFFLNNSNFLPNLIGLLIFVIIIILFLIFGIIFIKKRV